MFRSTGGTFSAGKYHNYLIGNNRTSVFAVGNIGSDDDFFLVGCNPDDDAATYPLLTGNILGERGEPLFRLVRNVITINPGNFGKVVVDVNGYDIVDEEGSVVMSVRTEHIGHPRDGDSYFLTTIMGNFYNKKQEIVLSATGGTGGFLQSSAPTLLGRGGARSNMDDDMKRIARAIQNSRGAINGVIKGKYVGEKITIDGKAIFEASFDSCELHSDTGEFYFFADVQFSDDCEIRLTGAAHRIYSLIAASRPQQS